MGQTVKAGQPYILHPVRVMMWVQTRYEMIAALLHDVVEDAPVTLHDLRREGFSERVVAARRDLEFGISNDTTY